MKTKVTKHVNARKFCSTATGGSFQPQHNLLTPQFFGLAQIENWDLTEKSEMRTEKISAPFRER